LLSVHDQSPALGLQLRAVAAAGIEEACVVVGFGAPLVEAHLRQNASPGLHVETLYNPFYAVADNLISCWVARSQMQSDFVLMNGDTLFAPSVLERLLAAVPAPDHARRQSQGRVRRRRHAGGARAERPAGSGRQVRWRRSRPTRSRSA